MKPHKGTITTWHRMTNFQGQDHIVGFFVDHPYVRNFSYTSRVVSLEGNELETEESRYTLDGPDIGYDEYMQRHIEFRRRTGYP